MTAAVVDEGAYLTALLIASAGVAAIRRALAELDGPTVYDQLVAERGGSARL